jgi:MinD-like ATPase involved in chromosome partitioning or flagellar assembly
MTDATTAALVGATGGAGTTRLVLETAATLALDGRRVAVFDAAFATQGLGTALSGSLAPDLTRVLCDDVSLDEAAVDLPLPAHTASDASATDGPVGERVGAVVCYPVAAPFTRLASAKTAAAARRFEECVAAAAAEVDHVLCDVPPVAANQAVAAVPAADRVGVVAPANDRGVDAVARTEARLADVDADCDLVVANAGTGPGTDPDLLDADVTVPTAGETALAAAPSCLDAESGLAELVATLAETLFETDLAVEFEVESGRFGGLLDR